MEEEIKKMLYEKIKHSEQGLTEGEAELAIYLLEEEQEKENKKTISVTTQTNEIQKAIEKAMKKKPEEIKIGKKITVTGTGGVGTDILLDDKYSIDRLDNFEIEMDPVEGAKVILEFFPHEIDVKTNRMGNITKKNGEKNE